MESFQRLLGSLQQAVNFISSFTAYLFGDEAHPGAEESRSTKSAHSCRHDGEAETKHDGDSPPRGPLGAPEDPLGAEVGPTCQHIQVTSEAAVGGGQDTEAIVKREGEVERQQTLSESSQLSGNGPEPRSMATEAGKISQRDLQEPSTVVGLHQREAEASIWMGAVQGGALEERAAKTWNQHWELDSSSAGSKDHAKLGGAGELNRGQEKELEEVQRSEGIRQGEPDLAWTGRSQHGEQEQAVKMVEGLQLGAKKKQGKEAENEQQDLAAKEGIQQGMLSRAETVEDQEQVLERGERVGSSLGWEPQGELEDVSGAEGNQERELEETLWNDRAADEVLFAGEEQRGLEEQAWSGGFQHGGLEVEAKMVEGQLAEAEREQEGEAEMKEGQQVEPDRGVEKKGIQQEMLSEVGTVEGQERMLERVANVRGSQGWGAEELEEAATGGTTQDQRKEVEEELQNEGVQQGAPEWALPEAEMEENQHRVPDGAVAKEGIQQAVLAVEEAKGDLEEVLEGEEQGAGCHWPETKEVVPAEVQDEGLKGVVGNENSQHGELAGAEGAEEGLDEPVRTGAPASGGEQGEAAREEWQGSEQEALMEKPAEDSRLEGGVLEDAETAEGQARPLEETDSSLQQGDMEDGASINTDAFSGLSTVLTEVTPLDTSAQKERVLLRRKSSIRRVPSLKRPRPSPETQPQETNIAEDAPSQPQLQAPRRPNLRHSGFGPMHPNMMAELQMRLRKPQ